MSTPVAAEVPERKKKRGTENVRDMLLSLGVVLAIIVPVWLVNSADDPDTRAIRVVDTGPGTTSLQQAVPGVPVPEGLPAGWRPTSSSLEGPQLRIGYVTPSDEYAEYAARGGSGQEDWLAEQTGQGSRGTELQVGDRAFEVWSNDEGATSLVLRDPAGAWSVVVGGVREEADDTALTELAGSLR